MGKQKYVCNVNRKINGLSNVYIDEDDFINQHWKRQNS